MSVECHGCYAEGGLTGEVLLAASGREGNEDVAGSLGGYHCGRGNSRDGKGGDGDELHSCGGGLFGLVGLGWLDVKMWLLAG